MLVCMEKKKKGNRRDENISLHEGISRVSVFRRDKSIYWRTPRIVFAIILASSSSFRSGRSYSQKLNSQLFLNPDIGIKSNNTRGLYILYSRYISVKRRKTARDLASLIQQYADQSLRHEAAFNLNDRKKKWTFRSFSLFPFRISIITRNNLANVIKVLIYPRIHARRAFVCRMFWTSLPDVVGAEYSKIFALSMEQLRDEISGFASFLVPRSSVCELVFLCVAAWRVNLFLKGCC